MAPKQSISQTSFAGIYSPNDVGEEFKGLVSFLNKSYLGYAITSTPVLYLERIENFWESAVAQGDEDHTTIRFKIKEHSYTLTIQCINAALGIVLEPRKTYTELASDETLKKLFLKIGYSGPCSHNITQVYAVTSNIRISRVRSHRDWFTTVMHLCNNVWLLFNAKTSIKFEF
ncbi:hypothetical protein POM88_050696 [Heracleum sosnowskyi]|uniref:Uncharacterized protein n=1 Tax=Heracleum sosnowskyi TaxID=360622 RepID=A0AAD8GY30_9APIA|nr:hypothetical protein POM88_050696 [Heracleum sosnowskyi]